MRAAEDLLQLVQEPMVSNVLVDDIAWSVVAVLLAVSYTYPFNEALAGRWSEKRSLALREALSF